MPELIVTCCNFKTFYEHLLYHTAQENKHYLPWKLTYMAWSLWFLPACPAYTSTAHYSDLIAPHRFCFLLFPCSLVYFHIPWDENCVSACWLLKLWLINTGLLLREGCTVITYLVVWFNPMLPLSGRLIICFGGCSSKMSFEITWHSVILCLNCFLLVCGIFNLLLFQS